MRAGDALWALGRKKEACDAFATCIELEPENKDVLAAYSKHQKEYIGTVDSFCILQIPEQFFAPLTKGMEVEVKYINKQKGRGVFAKRDFFEKEIVYLERPLSSHRNVDLAKVEFTRPLTNLTRITSNVAITQWSHLSHTQSFQHPSTMLWKLFMPNKICQKPPGCFVSSAKYDLTRNDSWI